MNTHESFPNGIQNVNEKGELSLEEKVIVDRIEKLEADEDAKVMIMLVWKGLKPVSEFEYAHYYSANDPKRAEQIVEAEKLFKELGLFSHRIEETTEGEHYDEKRNAIPTTFYHDKYYLAKKEEDLQYFTDHFGKEESFEITKKLGALLGYPPTATEAWNTKNKPKPILGWKHELYNHKEIAFSHFRFSQQNWAEEFETVKKWADEIKRLDPVLYESRVRSLNSAADLSGH